MNQHEKDREDQRQPDAVRPPIERDETLPDGAVHRTPERAQGQEAERQGEDRGRQEEEGAN